MMEIFLSFFLGIFANWIYTKLQRNIKPNLSLSSKIIYNTDKNKLILKAQNIGKRQIIDINIDFRIMEKIQYDDHSKQMLVKKLPPALYQKVLVPISDSNKNDGWGLLNACTFVIPFDNNILELLTNHTNERRIVVIVDSIDSESGTKYVFKKTYTINDIEYNKRFGKGLKILDIIKA